MIRSENERKKKVPTHISPHTTHPSEADSHGAVAVATGLPSAESDWACEMGPPYRYTTSDEDCRVLLAPIRSGPDTMISVEMFCQLKRRANRVAAIEMGFLLLLLNV